MQLSEIEYKLLAFRNLLCVDNQGKTVQVQHPPLQESHHL